MRSGQFHTKIAGVTHRNSDGSYRQQIIRRCQIGEAVRLSPEPWNEYDRNAIAVHRLSGEQLGYLSSELAADLAAQSSQGASFTASICGLTGGDGESCGVNLLVHRKVPTHTRQPGGLIPQSSQDGGALDFLEAGAHAAPPVRRRRQQKSNAGAVLVLAAVIPVVLLGLAIASCTRADPAPKAGALSKPTLSEAEASAKHDRLDRVIRDAQASGAIGNVKKLNGDVCELVVGKPFYSASFEQKGQVCEIIYAWAFGAGMSGSVVLTDSLTGKEAGTFSIRGGGLRMN